MSRNSKIIVGLIVALVLLCCCVAGIGGLAAYQLSSTFGSAMSTAGNPEQSAQVAAKIADFDLPAGYTRMGFSIMGFDMVMITPADNAQTAILLAQFPASAEVSPEMLQQQMAQVFQNQSRQGGQNMKVVGTEEITLRGQPVTLTVSEGESESGTGTVFRQKVGVFQGKGGTAMIMILGPADAWDQAAVDTITGSMR